MTIYSGVSSKSQRPGQKALGLPNFLRNFFFQGGGSVGKISLNGVRSTILEEQLVKRDHQRSSCRRDGVGARLEVEGYLLHQCWDFGVLVIAIAVVVLSAPSLGIALRLRRL